MNRLIVTRGNTVRLVRLLALRLVAVGLILGSLNLPAQVPVAAAAPMTADLLDAVNIVAHPSLVDATTYEQARALTFKNNAAIQRAALNGYLTDGVYQVVQRDYAKLNEDFASRAANDAGATFTKQVSKTPSCFSPGTDSDYIVQVTSPGQIDQMQAGYNQYVNQYLDSNGMLGPDEFGTEWHRMLDTDFMADPNLITSEADFQAIGAKNNAAYTRRQAADMERVLRDRPTEDVPPQSEMTPEGVRAYAQEMQDMAQHRNQMLDAITANGDHLLDGSDARADWFKNMAIEEKYISRVEVLTDALRQQNGLAAVDRGDAGSIALRGSKRAFYDQNGNLTSNIERSGAAASVADNSLNRANFELANTVAEVAKTNPAFAASAPADIAAIAKQMNPGQKGFLLEQLRQGGHDDLAVAVAKNMRDSWTPENDPAYQGRFKQASAQAQQQAKQDAASGVKPDSTFEAWDTALQNSLGINNDPSKIANLTRRQFNQLGQKWLPRMNLAMGEVFKAKELYDAGIEMGEYIDNLTAAWGPDVPDAVAQEHMANAQRIAQGMMVKGTFGATMLTVMEAFPTFGAIVGTFSISFNGTRWVMESTGADKVVTVDLAVSAIDVGNQAVEATGNAADYLWNGETQRQRETRLIMDTYLRALDRGDIILRDGVSLQDLTNAVNAGDMGGVRKNLIENGSCPIPAALLNTAKTTPPPAADSPASPAPGDTTAPVTAGPSPDKVYVFVLKGIGLVIATASDVATIHGCEWNGGGPRPCPAGKPAEQVGKAGKADGYASAADAHADLKTTLTCTNGYWGLKADVFGGQWLQNNVTSSDCKSIKQL